MAVDTIWIKLFTTPDQVLPADFDKFYLAKILEKIFCSTCNTMYNLLDIEMISITIFIGLSLILWYYLFWKPFDWYKDLTELGFDDIHRSTKYQNLSDAIKRNAINELRRRRKFGDVPPVYPNGWFVILESDDLDRNSVKEVSALGLNLVAWRGNSGKAYVADAYCPHLGAHLGVGGKVQGECIQCPFHGWSYTGEDGSLKNIPYSDTTPQFARIKMWKIMEMNGFIYLWFHAEQEEPNWFPEEFVEITSGEWKYRGRSEFKVGCHVQEIPENGADIAHFNVVHDKAMMCGGQPEHSLFKWEFIKHVWHGSWERVVLEEERHVAIAKVKHKMCIFNKITFLEMNVEIRQCGPSTVSLVFHSMFGKGVLFHTVTPVEPFVQKVLHRFYSQSSFIHPYGKLVLLGEAIMIERDIRIWNRKMFINKPLFVKEDNTIKKFRQWYSQFYSKNSPRYLQNGNSLEF